MINPIRLASEQVPEALTMAPKYLNMYGDFITKNASSVSQIESALRSLTYIIPGRFRESEIASETLHSGVQILSLYHDSLLARASSSLPPPKPATSAHSRYTRYWAQTSSPYKRIALLLQMIQYTELLWEMAARRRGEAVRWRVVVLLESIKAVCRFVLLRLTNLRPLLTPLLPEREVDPRVLETHDEEEGEEKEKESVEGWTMPRTGLALPELPKSDISSYLLSKVLTAEDIKSPKALLHRVTGQGQLAEILYILRPVIYALAMQRWRNNKSWRPWVIGLAVEYAARQLAKKEGWGVTGLEREESRRRGRALGWWVMRGAFYENVTK
ncbi:MAG: Peroxisomal membrane protein pex16 [Trizodia sp. TS-e1964]|nr:MAG: Peroxisomal membrane protein pex16 [Trizodia sp. TS-e1964]